MHRCSFISHPCDRRRIISGSSKGDQLATRQHLVSKAASPSSDLSISKQLKKSHRHWDTNHDKRHGQHKTFRTETVPRPENRYKSIEVGEVMRVGEHTGVKAAAGAVVASLTGHEKVLLLAYGAQAVYVAVRAVATARHMARYGRGNGMDILMQPALHSGPESRREKHGIRLYLYRSQHRLRGGQSTALVRWPSSDAGFSSSSSSCDGPRKDGAVVMRVGHATASNRLAGSITTVLQAGAVDGPGCLIQVAGAISTYRAIRGIAVARHVMLRKHLPADPTPPIVQQYGKSLEDPQQLNQAAAAALNTLAFQGSPEDRDLKGPLRHPRSLPRGRRKASEAAAMLIPVLDLVVALEWQTYTSTDGSDGRRIGMALRSCPPGQLEGVGGAVDEASDAAEGTSGFADAQEEQGDDAFDTARGSLPAGAVPGEPTQSQTGWQGGARNSSGRTAMRTERRTPQSFEGAAREESARVDRGRRHGPDDNLEEDYLVAPRM